jgi:hypothetical protein
MARQGPVVSVPAWPAPYPGCMVRSKSAASSKDTSAAKPPKKQGRIAQLRAVFAMTRREDPAVVWWMLLGFGGTLLVAFAVGWLIGSPIYITILGIPLGILVAVVVMARRAERAAYASIAGQPGATSAALQNLRRGWNVEQQPVAVDARTQDLVFRAVGRPGVVLVTEGPLPRANRLAENERKRTARLVGENVPVLIVNAGDGEGQVPLPKLGRHVMKMRGALTKNEVSEVSRRLRALGGVKLPIPKGVDPTRTRPDRRATRGR